MPTSYRSAWVHCLKDAQRGTVQLAVADDLDACLQTLTTIGEDSAASTRMLLRSWRLLPPHHELLEEMLNCLAHLAFAVWPDWYGASATQSGEVAALAVAELLERSRIAGLRREVNESWLRSATAQCSQQKLPRSRQVPAAQEAQQLALVLRPLRCILVVAALAAEQPPGRALGLARVCEWIAAEANIAVVVVLPLTVAIAAESDAINYRWLNLGGNAENIPANSFPQVADRGSAAVGEKQIRITPTTDNPEGEWLVTPIIGRPHPDSKGEQLLWAALSRDPELRGLFECNQPVAIRRTFPSTNFLVDFFSRSCRLVVEVDGYYWHSSPSAFSRDRQRDFELAVAGHLVLRLPHDEVIADVENAVEKIRTLVRFRRGSPTH